MTTPPAATAADPTARALILASIREGILDMAQRQDEFADPNIYWHTSDDARKAYRHAANMLREAAQRFVKAEPTPEATKC